MMITISIAISNFFSHCTKRTKISRLHSVCLFIFLFSFLSACTDKELYVQTDVLSLRTKPSESKEIVSRLRINTKVDVLEKRKGWVKVAMTGLDRNGWAPRSQFAKKPLTLDEAVKKAQSAEGAEKLAWLERAVAIGSRKEDWTSLLAAYQKAGLKDKAKDVRDFLDGRLPVYIAACYDRKALLLGVYTPESGLKELMSQAEDTELKRLSRDLATAAWYTADRELPIEGTLFPNPSLGILNEDQVAGPMTMYLILGKCPASGYFFATAPIDTDGPAPVEDIAADKEIRAILRDKTWIREFTSLTLARFSDSPVFYEVNFEGKSETKEPQIGWMLMDDEYQSLSSCEELGKPRVFPLTLEGCKDEPGLSCSAIVEDSSWVRLRFGPPVRIGVRIWSRGATEELKDERGFVYETRSGGSNGLWFVLIKETGCVQVFDIMTEEAGY